MKTWYYLVAILVFLAGCKKEDTAALKSYSIRGVAQKGPFVQGSKVTVYELNDKLEQTGKVFKTETSDDFGSFELKDMLLSSSWVQIEVEGTVYNELYGGHYYPVSMGNIVDLDKGNVVNVNLTGDLARLRLKYLVKNGTGFHAARTQAEREVMKAFGLDTFYVTGSENLDISSGNDAGSALLTLSSIVLAGRNKAQIFLDQYLAKLRGDMENDGLLNDADLLNSIKLAMAELNPDEIANNLSEFYGKTIPSFSTHLNVAKNKLALSNFSFMDVTFPAENNNILAMSEDTLNIADSAANLVMKFPTDGYKKLKITIYADSINELVIDPDYRNLMFSSGYATGETKTVEANENKKVYELNCINGIRCMYIKKLFYYHQIYIIVSDISGSQEIKLRQRWVWLNKL